QTRGSVELQEKGSGHALRELTPDREVAVLEGSRELGLKQCQLFVAESLPNQNFCLQQPELPIQHQFSSWKLPESGIRPREYLLQFPAIELEAAIVLALLNGRRSR